MPPSLTGLALIPFCFCGGFWAPSGQGWVFSSLCPQYPAQSPALQGAQTLFVEWNGTKTDSSGWSCHCRVETGPKTSHPSWFLAWRRWTTTWQETSTKTISEAWFLHSIISHPLQLYLFIWAHVILSHISCSSAPTSLSPISSWNVQLSPEGYSEPSPPLLTDVSHPFPSSHGPSTGFCFVFFLTSPCTIPHLGIPWQRNWQHKTYEPEFLLFYSSLVFQTTFGLLGFKAELLYSRPESRERVKES